MEELKQLDSKLFSATINEARKECVDCPMCSNNIERARNLGATSVILVREKNSHGDLSDNLHAIGVDFND